MASKNKIYTKTGDDGTTGLFGGTRIKKYDDRIEAYGTIDELNSYIGMVRSFDLDESIKELLLFIQNKLFIIGAKLASDEKGEMITKEIGCKQKDIQKIEKIIDKYEEALPELKNFIIPGGNQLVSFCHICRTVCRRAERRIVKLSENDFIPENMLIFMNRLSDFFFVLSRKLAFDNNLKETSWQRE